MTDETSSGPEKAAPAALEAAPADKPAAGSRLTPHQWAEIEAAWLYGTATGQELSDKYSISLSALSQHFKRHNIVKNAKRHEIELRAKAEIAKSAASKEATFGVLRMERIEKTKNESYQLATAITALLGRYVKEIADGTVSADTMNGKIKALERAKNVLGGAMDIRYRVLKADEIDTDDDLPELKILDLTADEIAELRKRGDEDDGERIPEVAAPDLSEIVEEGA